MLIINYNFQYNQVLVIISNHLFELKIIKDGSTN